MAITHNNIPIVRRNGIPVMMNFQMVNRSELIRELFRQRGINTPNWQIKRLLFENNGVRISETTINKQRIKLLENPNYKP